MSDVNVSGDVQVDSTPQTPAPATSGQPAPPVTGATPQVTTQAQTPATGAPPQEGWVPSYRVRETREAAIREANAQFAAREASIRAEADQYRAQLHRLVGVGPQPNPEVEAVRNQFGSLYPNLAKLEERGADILSIIEKANDIEAQNNHYWQSYGKQTMDRLYTHAQDSLGGPLNDEAKRALHSSFVGFVQSSPEMSERYANDPSLVEDFWKLFTSSFVDPVRRSASATVAGRAAAVSTLPQNTPGSGIPTTNAPKPANLEERAAAAWTMYNQPKG